MCISLLTLVRLAPFQHCGWSCTFIGLTYSLLQASQTLERQNAHT
ncbi:hypothetical protein SEVIR_3G119301v4 [Setaria viridis]